MIGFYDYTVLATYAATALGVTGMFQAVEGRPLTAVFCLLAAALIPFLPTMALLALVMAAGLALILTYGMGRGGIGGYQPTFRWTVLLALCYLFSIFTSVAPGRSLLPGLLMAAFMLFAPAVYLSVKKYGDIRRILAVIALGGVLVSLYGFWQRLNPGDYNTGWVDKDELEKVICRFFGEKNVETFRRGYNEVKLYTFE